MEKTENYYVKIIVDIIAARAERAYMDIHNLINLIDKVVDKDRRLAFCITRLKDARNSMSEVRKNARNFALELDEEEFYKGEEDNG